MVAKSLRPIHYQIGFIAHFIFVLFCKLLASWPSHNATYVQFMGSSCLPSSLVVDCFLCTWQLSTAQFEVENEQGN